MERHAHSISLHIIYAVFPQQRVIMSIVIFLHGRVVYTNCPDVA